MDDGNVWSFGYGDKGQLGHNDLSNIKSPKLIQSLTKYKITHIACGSLHNTAICNQNNIFSWGNNEDSQCGLGENKAGFGKNIKTPTIIDININNNNNKQPLIPLYSTCGGYHTLLLTKTGLLLSFGNGKYCGHKSNETQYIPKTIETLKTKQIIHISTGYYHNLCIDNNGKIYSWGEGQWGKLGHGNENHEQIPKEIEFFSKENIKGIYCNCGYAHSSIISSKKELYMFGRGDW